MYIQPHAIHDFHDVMCNYKTAFQHSPRAFDAMIPHLCGRELARGNGMHRQKKKKTTNSIEI